MSPFYGYGVVGVTDSSYKKVLARDIDYTSRQLGRLAQGQLSERIG